MLLAAQAMKTEKYTSQRKEKEQHEDSGLV